MDIKDLPPSNVPQFGVSQPISMAQPTSAELTLTEKVCRCCRC